MANEKFKSHPGHDNPHHPGYHSNRQHLEAAQQEQLFWARWMSLLTIEGEWEPEDAMATMSRYQGHERDWPEGKDDYKMLAELLVGRAIAWRMGTDIYDNE